MNALSLHIAGRVLVCASLVLLPVRAWAQEEDESFRRGISARGDKKWADVAAEMRRAIAINPMESTRKVQIRSRLLFGGSSTEYLPHYYLGEALKNEQDCAAAVTEWEISEDQKAVQTVEEAITDLRAGYKECAAKGILLREEFRQQQALTEQPYNDAVGNFRRLESLRGTSPDLFKSDVDTEFERARTDLALAYKGMLKARTSRMVVDFSESRSATTRATSVLRPLEAKLRAAIDTRTLITQQVAEVQQMLTRAEAADRDIDAVKITLTPELSSSRETARGLVKGSRERLGVAEKTQNATAAGDALRLAQDASRGFATILEQLKQLARGEVEQRLQQAVAATTEQLSFLAASFATLERLVTEKGGAMTPEMSAERESLQKEHSSLQRRFENSRRTQNVAAVDEATRLAIDARTRLDALIKMFGPATLRDRGVHQALEEGARLYFNGEYQQVLSALAPLGSAIDVLLQVHVHLFRAASFYALYVRSGQTNEDLLARAVAAVRRCKEIEPGFQPSPRAFSPRFLDFFQNPGASGSPATMATAQ